MAGNEGNDADRLASPGIDPFVITVAGADADDDGLSIADFSNGGDGIRNPDVAAPGAHIQSLRATGSNADLNHSDVGTSTAYSDDMLFTGTGTSQSTAVTAGVVALLYQQHPDLTPDQAKSMLTTTAQPIAGSDSSAGANLVRADLAAAAAITDATQTFTPAVQQAPIDTSAVTACTLDRMLGRRSLGRRSLGRRTLGRRTLGRRTLGRRTLGRRTLGRRTPGRRTLGWSTLGRRTLGGAHLGGAHLGGAHLGGAHSVGRTSGGAHLGGAHSAAHTGAAHTRGGAHWGGAHSAAHTRAAHTGAAHTAAAHTRGGAHWGGAHSAAHTSAEHTSAAHTRRRTLGRRTLGLIPSV